MVSSIWDQGSHLRFHFSVFILRPTPITSSSASTSSCSSSYSSSSSASCSFKFLDSLHHHPHHRQNFHAHLLPHHPFLLPLLHTRQPLSIPGMTIQVPAKGPGCQLSREGSGHRPEKVSVAGGTFGGGTGTMHVWMRILAF